MKRAPELERGNVGAKAGPVILPVLSDRYHRRMPVLLLGMIVAAPALVADSEPATQSA